jgi:HlyD family secretion protein
VVAGQLVTYPVRVTLDAGDEPIRIGMSATATIVVNEVPDALILPNRFLRIDRATQQAFVTVERSTGVFEEVPVELGLRNETESQIVEGIEAGQRVVLLPRGTFDPFGGP